MFLRQVLAVCLPATAAQCATNSDLIYQGTIDMHAGVDRFRPLPGGIALRRGAGVVERGGLENRCARERTQGSNPCLSAIFSQ